MSDSSPHESVPADWVPVERRWLGLDKRTIAPGLIALALIALFVVVLPAIDRAIDYDRETQAGDDIDLGSGVTFVPATGWGFPDGLLLSDETTGGAEDVTQLGATVVNGGLSLTAITGDFEGTADELLGQVNALNETYKSIDNSKYKGDRVTATTDSGLVGVAQGFVGVNVEGVIAAFVVEGVGVEFVVNGPPGSLDDNAIAVYTMITSLDSTTEGDR